MGNNITRLGASLSERMKRTAKTAVPVVIEFGTINGNLSLSVDSLSKPIPKGSYMVNLMLASSSSYRTSTETHTHSGGGHSGHLLTEDGSHTHSGGSHSHAMPSSFRPLKKGDRVVVIWNGYKPVVIAIIVNS